MLLFCDQHYSIVSQEKGESCTTMASRQMSRTPPPRQLLANETLQSLSHWKPKFKTFYKQDGMIATKYLKTWFSVEPKSGDTENLMLIPGMQLSFNEDLMDP